MCVVTGAIVYDNDFKREVGRELLASKSRNQVQCAAGVAIDGDDYTDHYRASPCRMAQACAICNLLQERTVVVARHCRCWYCPTITAVRVDVSLSCVTLAS